MADDPPRSDDPERQLRDQVASYAYDPYGYVMFAFPWGDPDRELAEFAGPREWQKQLLIEIGAELRAGVITVPGAIAKVLYAGDPILDATSSGHGIGKSALVAMLILWAMSTFEDTKGVVTANTENQLKTRSWAELSKWYRLATNRSWFTLTATALYSSDPAHERTWRIDMVPWSEHKTEAFAGLHNKGKRLLIIFDEASGIPDKIWEVTEGALTDEHTEILWFVFGNPTRNTGRFRECFGKFKHRWRRRRIDSRTVEGTNKKQIAKWLKDYSEDSDFFRVRVRGRHPNASDLQFIALSLIAKAMHRTAIPLAGDPLIMAVDVARGGGDNCVIRWRRGLDARSQHPPRRLSGEKSKDSMVFVSWVTMAIEETRPDAVFMDETGVGGPCGDRLRQLGYNVIGVQFGGHSPDPHYANMRSYMWMMLKEAMHRGLALDEDEQLEEDLKGPEYHHDRHDKICLEPKESMKARGLASPDEGDATAMLFAYPVAPKLDPLDEARLRMLEGDSAKPGDWDPYDDRRM